MSKMLKFCLRIRYSSRSSGPSKVSRKTSSASGGMYRSVGMRNSGSPYRRASATPSTVCVAVADCAMAPSSAPSPVAGALLGFQRRLLGLQVVDEGAGFGLVGLPEQRHGGFEGKEGAQRRDPAIL